MWAHSLRIRGPRQSIPIALVGSKETSDSNTSEVEIEMSERVEDNVGRESRGGNSKELSVKMEKKYLLKSEALSKSEVAKAEHNSTDGGMELWPEIPLMYLNILLQLELGNSKMNVHDTYLTIITFVVESRMKIRELADSRAYIDIARFQFLSAIQSMLQLQARVVSGQQDLPCMPASIRPE